jgi:hypothetical protein
MEGSFAAAAFTAAALGRLRAQEEYAYLKP